jgi:hypothetical protein
VKASVPVTSPAWNSLPPSETTYTGRMALVICAPSELARFALTTRMNAVENRRSAVEDASVCLMPPLPYCKSGSPGFSPLYLSGTSVAARTVMPFRVALMLSRLSGLTPSGST